MNITVNNHTVLLTPEEQRSAAQHITALGRDTSDLRTAEGKRLPPEVNNVITQVLHAIKDGYPSPSPPRPKRSPLPPPLPCSALPAPR